MEMLEFAWCLMFHTSYFENQGTATICTKCKDK